MSHRAPASELAAVQHFRANVRTLLDEAKGAGLTQAKLAEAAEVSLRTLGDQLNVGGNTAPNIRLVQAVADATGVQPWELLFPDFAARLVLNPSLRGRFHSFVERYLNAEPAGQEAIEKVASALPQRTK